VSPLIELIYDANRFLMYHMFAIELWPLQTYASALLYSPTTSGVRRSFESDAPSWVKIKPEMEKDWSSCIQTLEAGTHEIKSMDFNSTRLVIASGDEVTIWDPVNGQRVQTLTIHNGPVNSVALSYDSSKVVVGTQYLELQLWDAVNGLYLYTLEEKPPYRRPEARTGSKSTGTLLQHRHNVVTVAFSQDSKRLASASDGGRLKVWDIDARQCLKELSVNNFENLKSEFKAFAIAWGIFSPHLTCFAYKSAGAVVIYNLRSKERSQFSNHASSHSKMTASGKLNRGISATSRTLTTTASAISEAEILIWNLDNNGNMPQTINANGTVLSITFSQDSKQLACVSLNGTIKIWNLDTYQARRNYGNYNKESVKSFVDRWPQGLRGFGILLSPHSTHVALVDGTSKVNIWTVYDGGRYTIGGHDHHIECVDFSHGDSTRLISGSRDGKIKIWALSTRECLQTFYGHTDCVCAVAISSDSSRLVSVSRDGTAKLWNVMDGSCSRTIAVDKHYSCVRTALSPDSNWMALEISNRGIEVFDIRNNDCGRKSSIPRYTRTTSMALSREPTRLAIASQSFVVSVWDVHSNVRMYTFDCKDQVNQMSFDSTGLFLSTNVGMIDIHASLATSMITGIVPAKYSGLALVEDRQKITYNSKLLIWLPPEYQAKPGYFDVVGNVVALLDRSGRLWLHKFDLHNLP
jgi:WD40 repeat protein